MHLSLLAQLHVKMFTYFFYVPHFDGLVQESRKSIAKALELCLYFTNSSIWY